MDLEAVIDQRIAAALSKQRIGLNDLPLAALRRKLLDDLSNADGDTTLQPHSVGVDALGVLPAARITKAAAQSIPNNVLTASAFDTVTFDSAGMASLSAVRLTAPVDAIYLAAGAVGWATNGTGVRLMNLYKPGGILIQSNVVTPAASDPTRQNLSDTVFLKRGEYIEASVYQNSGGVLGTEAAMSMSLTFLTNYLTTT